MDRYRPSDLSKDAAFDLAREEQRRIVVGLLLEGSREWDLRALADATVRERAGGAEREASDRTLLTLRHRDLPKLAAAGVVDYDADDRTVAPGERIEDLEPLV
ncbi:hypothetical protein BRC94_05715 [Halobacteriales archaeon QS_5_70_17]|nr:MAG: hypothetical protein BRC94_05715 [Halobacteriales archaeon QS_5_70_17]